LRFFERENAQPARKVTDSCGLNNKNWIIIRLTNEICQVFFEILFLLTFFQRKLLGLFNNPVGCLTSLADLAGFLQKSAKSAVF
jgi:hypothetical protein